MREEDEIRAAVVALAEAVERGEDVSDALPASELLAGTAALGDEPGPVTPEEARAQMLAAVFDAVRSATRESRLSCPAEWEAQGLVPEGMTAEDVEMAVYERLMAAQESGAWGEGGIAGAADTGASGAAGAAEEEVLARRSPQGGTMGTRPTCRHVRSAFSSSNGRAVGAPVFKRRHEEPGGEGAPQDDRCEDEGSAEVAAAPEAAEPGADLFADCRDIRLLMGAASYYLYDASAMTDAYARWAFLAAEDDPVATFIECVREESSVYPRPMARDTLANEPFCMDAAAVEAAFATAREQQRAADLERTEASNGDVYFYSTRFLSPRRAQALAEWDAVERHRNV